MGDDSPDRMHGHGNWALQTEAAMRSLVFVVVVLARVTCPQVGLQRARA